MLIAPEERYDTASNKSDRPRLEMLVSTRSPSCHPRHRRFQFSSINKSPRFLHTTFTSPCTNSSSAFAFAKQGRRSVHCKLARYSLCLKYFNWHISKSTTPKRINVKQYSEWFIFVCTWGAECVYALFSHLTDIGNLSDIPRNEQEASNPMI